MIVKGIIVSIVLCITNIISAQNFKNYYSIEPVYNFNFSKTNLDRSSIPLNKLGTPIEWVKAFGRNPQYLNAIKELEQALYNTSV